MNATTQRLPGRRDEQAARDARNHAPPAGRHGKPRSAPTEEEIAECAYWIWESEGHPIGREEEHWRQAELQLYIDCALNDALESNDETG